MTSTNSRKEGPGIEFNSVRSKDYGSEAEERGDSAREFALCCVTVGVSSRLPPSAPRLTSTTFPSRLAGGAPRITSTTLLFLFAATSSHLDLFVRFF